MPQHCFEWSLVQSSAASLKASARVMLNGTETRSRSTVESRIASNRTPISVWTDLCGMSVEMANQLIETLERSKKTPRPQTQPPLQLQLQQQQQSQHQPQLLATQFSLACFAAWALCSFCQGLVFDDIWVAGRGHARVTDAHVSEGSFPGSVLTSSRFESLDLPAPAGQDTSRATFVIYTTYECQEGLALSSGLPLSSLWYLRLSTALVLWSSFPAAWVSHVDCRCPQTLLFVPRQSIVAEVLRYASWTL
ncbi:hypothetical protein A4X09_0g7511 [Tilletia walkeri]|uniref:Uncharacterized protein n=1 Tax=Tilletia walkeri TaxID=117179 RepID=A0A8X7T1D8_9BASI|nr:hypothetical protein A4X09_0g7511 [Tilletia walkeri]